MSVPVHWNKGALRHQNTNPDLVREQFATPSPVEEPRSSLERPLPSSTDDRAMKTSEAPFQRINSLKGGKPLLNVCMVLTETPR